MTSILGTFSVFKGKGRFKAGFRDILPEFGIGMEGRNENGGKVFHRHHSGGTKRVVVKIESRRFLIFRPSSEWPNAKKGSIPAERI